MKLTVLSHYGSNQKIISDNAAADDIIQTMSSLNWSEFHQVVLEQDNGDWMEIGGNIGEDGLSAIYEENGQQYVIDRPPGSVAHITAILLSYYAGDGKFKIDNNFQ